MNKKLSRLFRPVMGFYFIFMLGFAVAAALMQDYVLAGLELVITAALFTLYLILKNQRRIQLQKYLDTALQETEGITGAKTPFPIVVTRMGDEGIVYVNDAFLTLTGFQDTMAERQLSDILPGFTTDWLSSGKTE